MGKDTLKVKVKTSNDTKTLTITVESLSGPLSYQEIFFGLEKAVTELTQLAVQDAALQGDDDGGVRGQS